MTNKHKGLLRLYYAVGYSWKGFKAAFIHEAAFRQELFGFIFLCPLAFWLGKTKAETAILLSVLVLVLVAELINSAIEAVVDRFGGEIHELSGRAKDMAAAAVLLCLILAVAVWILILVP